MNTQKKHRVLVIGANARQSSLAWRIAQSELVEKVYYLPGRPVENVNIEYVDIAADDIEQILTFSKTHNISFVIPDSGTMMETGLVDKLRSLEIPVFGPNKHQAQLETSKSFAKSFMSKHNIPTARYEVFENISDIKNYVNVSKNKMFVVKADGLRRGRGVTVCSSKDEAIHEATLLLSGEKFGDPSSKVVIEEYLEGPEVSVHVLIDESGYKVFPLSQDHKPINEGNTGPNTGGMGTYAPLDWVSREYVERIEREIIQPTIEGLKKDGLLYRGLLFPGLMLTADGPKVLEYNTRFGAPETQTYMMLLENDVFQILYAVATGNVANQQLRWSDKYAVTVEVVSQDYPHRLTSPKTQVIVKKGIPFDGFIFLSDIEQNEDTVFAVGGKILSVCAIGETLEEAIAEAYKGVDSVSFKGKKYRKDIGSMKKHQF